MRKTTIYLPDQLKERIERAARLERRSEADVIRSAIDSYVESSPPRPRLPLFESGDVAPIDNWDEAMRGFGED